MTDVVDELLARLWPGRDLRVEPLLGGTTNANFLVHLDDERVVLRIPGRNSELLGIDRRAEVIIGQLVASIGIGPDVLANSETEGWMVTRFLSGRSVSPDELARESRVSEVAATLRRLHGVGKVRATFNPFSVVRAYHDLAHSRTVLEPFDYPNALSLLQAIADARPFRPTALCHNDLLSTNFLDDGALRLLDWEYAGMGDPFFDLANFSANQQLSPAMDESLLAHYWGHCDESSLAVLSLMKVVSELRETMWGVAQQALSTLDVDFDGYAQGRSQRYLQLLDSIDFEDALRRAATFTPSAPEYGREPA